jgi:hypothetical protein
MGDKLEDKRHLETSTEHLTTLTVVDDDTDTLIIKLDYLNVFLIENAHNLRRPQGYHLAAQQNRVE